MAANEQMPPQNVDPPLVTVLLVTWNRKSEIGKSLDSALSQTYPNIEIIVVDNASPDGTYEYLKENYPAVRVIRTHKNMGCPSARNIGFANCRGKYIYSLDDDGWLDKNAIEILVRELESLPQVGVVMSQIHEVERDGTFVRKKPANVDGPAYLGSFIGCCFLIRKEVIRTVGGFQDDFFRGAEEGELSLRMMSNGWLIRILPESIMYHAPSPVGRDQKMFYYYGLRNTMKAAFRTWPFPWNWLRAFSIIGRSIGYGICRCHPLLPLKILGHFIVEPWISRKLRNPASREAWRKHRQLYLNPSSEVPEIAPPASQRDSDRVSIEAA
jgi:hypothetical protein